MEIAKRRLILYRSPRHQLSLKTNIKYGLIPHKLKYQIGIKSRKCQERMMKTFGRKYIQFISYIVSLDSQIASRMIFLTQKLSALTKISFEIPFVSNIEKITLINKRLASSLFSRCKHIKRTSITTSNARLTSAQYLKPLLLLNSSQHLKLSALCITPSEKLNHLEKYFSLASKRKIWPHLKTLVLVLPVNIGLPIPFTAISSLNKFLNVLENPKFCPSIQIGLKAISLTTNPIHQTNWDFLQIFTKNKALSHLQISMKEYFQHYENLLKVLQNTHVRSIYLLNSDLIQPQALPLIPSSIGQLESLRDLRLWANQMSEPDCIAKTFDVISQSTKLQTLILHFINISLDNASLKVMSDAICNLKSLQTLRLTLHLITFSGSEIDEELNRFLKRISILSSLKQLDFDWTGLQNCIDIEYFQLLCESLQNLTELKSLKIAFSSEKINSDCLENLTKFFSTKPKIETLDIKLNIPNAVAPEDLIQWVKSIKELVYLSDFSLELDFEGGIDIEFVRELGSSLESLKSLNLVSIQLKKKNGADVIEGQVSEVILETAERLKTRMEVGYHLLI